MKDAFLKYLSFEKRLSAHTITSYSNDLNQFLLFYKSYCFSDDLIKVDKRAVRSWIVELSLQNLSQAIYKYTFLNKIYHQDQ